MKATFEETKIYWLMPASGEGEAVGPYSLAELAEMKRTGEIDEETLWAVEGMETWERIATLRKLMTPREEERPDPGLAQKVTRVLCGETFDDQPKARRAPRMEPLFRVASPGTPKWKIGLAMLAGGFGLFMLIPALALAWQGPKGLAGMEASEAHVMAVEFIERSYPGARSFGEPVVKREGNTFYVAVEVDGLNAFGGPVRNTMGVEMELVGSSWRLRHIERR